MLGRPEKQRIPLKILFLEGPPQKYSLVLTALSPTIMLKVEMYKWEIFQTIISFRNIRNVSFSSET